MSNRSSFLSWLAVLILIAGLGVGGLYEFGGPRVASDTSGLRPDTASHDSFPATGQIAAAFTLKDLSGKKVSLSSFRGKVVFLNIWATWCGPCREEMPSIESLYSHFKNTKNFVILGVSEDTEGKAAVAPYITRNGYHFRILLDPENVVGEKYGVSGVPETFIIDQQGRIVAHHMGAYDWSRSDIRAALEDLLASKAA